MNTPFVTEIDTLDAAQARRATEHLVNDTLRSVLQAADRAAPPSFRITAAFKDLGLDSLLALALADQLGRAIGTSVAPSLPFDHPTPAALAKALLVILRGPDDTEVLDTAAGNIERARTVFDEPIAIVSMACRYPGGVSSPEDLWALVADEVDAIGPLPTDRGWNLAELFDENPDRPGTSYARHGGFIEGAAHFDPGFFGISPREALAMDPQQRLLLEVTWEAFERAGIDPTSLKGSGTGVFVGAEPQDYGPRLQDAPDGLDGYLMTGAATSVLSGRISYVLGLNGPTLTVDTACSASLVALHLAMRSLRSGECDLAVAGGVAVMSSPGTFTAFSRQRGLSKDGRCKAFSADADGTGWAEGAGMLVLERLSDAQANGHPVLAVLRGSAMNSDGASNGLTAPNGPAQQRVIRAALADAGLHSGEIDLIEAHGTGTSLGDPIEAQAILATYGDPARRDRSARLGSLKSNIGHAQAAAGVGGVIKVVQAIRHELMPATLHVGRPSEKIDWTAGEVELLTAAAPWPASERPRRGAVSSFGISGTNAHVILEQAPDLEQTGEPAPEGQPIPALPFVWPLSARTPDALRDRAAQLLSFVTAEIADGRTVEPGSVSAALSGRARFEHGGVAIGADTAALLSRLTTLAAGETAAGTVLGDAVAGELAILFTGQGAQRIGMGRELHQNFPVFRRAFDDACDQLDLQLEVPLREVVFAEPGSEHAALLNRTGYTQPALFALEVALFRLVESCGVTPDVVGGHSVGEIAAAHVAGVLTLEDAALLVGLRASLMQALPEGGAMVAIAASEDEVLAELCSTANAFDGVDIAAVNGPTAVVVAGVEDRTVALAEIFAARGVRTRRLSVSHAFHSPLMEPMLAEFGDMIELLTFSEPTIPVLSCLTGRLAVPGQLTDPQYWVRHVRQAVRFADGVVALLANDVDTVLELGPDAVLTAMAAAVAEAALEDSARPTFSTISLMRRERMEVDHLVSSLAELWVRGHQIRFEDVAGHHVAGRTDLPTYPFQRERYWLDSGRTTMDLSGFGMVMAGHPLVGVQLDLAASGGMVLTGQLSTAAQSWLGDHVVAGSVLVPGTAFVEMAVQAADRCGAGVLEELIMESPLYLADSSAAVVQVAVGAQDDRDGYTLEIFSRPAKDPEASWIRHATGYLSAAMQIPRSAGDLAGTWPPAGAVVFDTDDLYPRLTAEGYDYGPAFQGVQRVWHRHRGDVVESFAEIELPSEQDEKAFALHPALLDAVLQSVGLDAPAGQVPEVPFSFNGVRLLASGARHLRVHSVAVDGGVQLTMADRAGQLVAVIDSVVTRPLTRAAAPTTDGQLLEISWQNGAFATTSADRAMLLASASRLDPTRPVHADLPALVAAIQRGAAIPDFVVTGLDGTGEDITAHVQQVLTAIQQFLAEPTLVGTALVFARASGATGDGPEHAASAALGLIRSAAAEHPGRFLVVDADDESGAAALRALSGSLAAGESEFAVRSGKVLVPRLAPVPAEVEAGSATSPWTADGTVLITGGTGGLGLLVARHLVAEHGVRHLVLLSRRGISAPGAAAAAEELTAQGATVTFAAADAGDRPAMVEVLAGIPAGHPLRAVVHAAGLLDDGLVEGLTPQRLQRVMAAKSESGWLLHELTEAMPLTAFVLFSSAAATVDGTGQGNYAAANASLEALARHRHRIGLPATSIGWTLWAAETGMAGSLQAADLARIAASGLPALQTTTALSLFDAAVASGISVTSALRIDAAAMRERALGVPPVLRGLVRTGVRRTVAGGTATGRTDGLGDVLAGLESAARLEHLRTLVRTQAALALGFTDPSQVQLDRAFSSLGLDSLAAVDLRNRLNAVTGLRLPATLVFDHPNSDSIAKMLIGKFGDVTPAPTAASAQAPAAQDDPIVIVGMGCRYPGGVGSAEDLWNLVINGRDGITDFPVNRGWNLDELYDPEPGLPDRTYCIQGGFLHDADEFDGDFFGIPPREALATDPQQRLLLEASWEALEDARIDPLSLRGSRTGVFAGVMYHDFASRLRNIPSELKGYIGNGGLGSVVSGRVSYTFGLEGPAVSIDTACSSSLVALHQAAGALRAGECDLALAGGVTVMTGPDTFVDFSLQRGLAADGRCKSFSDDADGTGWGEGVGVLVLERLSDAERLGHPVLAVVRGSAVNQDGASNGLTAPNGPAQQRVIEAALAVAGLTSRDIELIEGHGTGTTLGDPIEAQALLATYGQHRDAPAYLGSLKSNIGHTQAAAGVGGVIKMVQAMRHAQMPPSLYAATPTQSVDWAEGQISLLTQAREWPAVDRPRRAAVSSFGISGTNAHVILEEFAGASVVASAGSPAAGLSAAVSSSAVSSSAGSDSPVPVVLSARSAAALAGQAGRLLDFLAVTASSSGSVPLLSAVAGGVWGRSRFDHRAVVVGSSHAEVISGLQALAEARPSGTVVSGAVGRSGSEVGVVFTGQGAQRVGMCAGLYESYPVFAAAFDQAVAAIDAVAGSDGSWVGLKSVVFAEPGSAAAALLDRTRYTQPALFAVESALFALASSFGLTPAVVAGHSVGEITAAHVAAVLTLEDAALLVVTRGALMDALPSGGGMAAIGTDEQTVQQILADYAGVEVAAVNSPTSTVISGDIETVQQLVQVFTGRGVRCKQLTVSHAFHSALMVPMLAEFEQALAGIEFGVQRFPVVSGVTGKVAEPGLLQTAQYWADHVRAAVRFADTVTTIAGLGVAAIVEVGPDAALTAPTQDTLEASPSASNITVVGLQRRDRDQPTTFLTGLAQLLTIGAPIDFTQLLDTTTRVADLPTYAFDHQRYWLIDAPGQGDVASAGLSASEHPLLGAVVETSDGGVLATGRLSLGSHPWLADHRVNDQVVVPGTGVLDLAITVGRLVGAPSVRELLLLAPLVVPGSGTDVRVSVSAVQHDTDRQVQVHSRITSADPWTLNASGVVGTIETNTETLGNWPPASAIQADISGRYRDLAAAGLAYGPVFAGLATAWVDGDTVYGEVSLPPGTPVAGFQLHPALFDAALHVLGLTDDGTNDTAELPFAFSDVVVHAADRTAARVRATKSVAGSWQLTLFDETGIPVAQIGSLTLRSIVVDQVAAAASKLLTVSWVPVLPSQNTVTAGPSLALIGAGPEVIGAERFRDLGELVASGVRPDAVIAHLGGHRSGGSEVMDAAAIIDAAADALTLIQSMITASQSIDSTFVLLTHGAVGVDQSERIDDLAASAMRGLVKAAIAEHPGSFVLLDHDGHTEAVGAAVAAGEPEVAIRKGKVLVARLTRAGIPTPPIAGDSAGQVAGDGDRNGAVLITGGTNGLGARLAEHLARQRPGRQLVLMSRRGSASPEATELLATLADSGAETYVLAADVADAAAIRAGLDSLPSEVRIGSIVHGAGVLADATVAAGTAEQLQTVCAPKLEGLQALEEALPDVERFVVFSSVAATLDASGQATYAAANSVLDAWAHNRRQAGRPGVAIAWGLWGEDGMGASLQESARRRIEASGVIPLSTADGLAMFDAATAPGRSGHLVAGGFDLAVIARDAAVSPIWGDMLPKQAQRRVAAPAVVEASMPDQLASIPADQRAQHVQRAVRGQVAEVLGYATPDAVDVDRGFGEMGFDSLAAVELRNRLTKLAGCKLPATVTFDFPNVVALAEHLTEQLTSRLTPVATAAPAMTPEDQLGRLEEMLLRAEPTGDAHSRIVQRLQAITAAWIERGGVAAADRAEIATASAEDIFSILDEEFDSYV
ncbi:acyl transferase domain-containing protein/acyl carrier protein [Nakamurella sp. UYEF19]|uniref:SDR family NAD(P)-dependent oxidoreductase n=1 Tax=Nakamurella sp. UYEF19 TaxID=1756392 RepID=UPI00339B1117